ncbi:MAG: hypothetical protein PHC56_08470 [Herbinix sp.]|nr:hypothetical protein [Herbinix sp.]
MFLKYLQDDYMICDFQLVYETDSKLHIDFYAYGLLKEPAVLDVDSNYTLVSYGMVKIDSNEYVRINNRINTIKNEIPILFSKLYEMRNSMYRLIQANKVAEDAIENGQYDISFMKKCFEAITDVMAYRRLADEAGEYYSEKITNKRLSQIGIPSYLNILEKNKNNIESLSDASLFVKEYGYLNSFNIKANMGENINNIKIKKDASENIQVLKLDYDDSGCVNIKERLVYGLSWFSELRHIYQLRTLRNFRWYFENKNLDVHLTGARELFKI